MRRFQGLAIAAIVIALIGAAGMVRMFAPDDYGRPTIEVAEPGPTGVRVAEQGVIGNYFPADGAGPHAGVLVLGGSEGGLGRGAKYTAIALQKEGFSVLQLAYFGAPGTAETLEEIPLETFDRGLAWLAAQPGVDARRLAVVGASKGAEAALLIATRQQTLRAVVAGMPSSVAWNGINWGQGVQSRLSSWTQAGQSLPTVPFTAWNQAEGVISVYRGVLDPTNAAAIERAAIRIEAAEAATLLVCGEAETMWPACPMARALEARAQRLNGPAVEILAYRDAGHLVFGPPISRDNAFYPQLAMLGGSVEGNAAARTDSWPRVVAFLRARTAPID